MSSQSVSLSQIQQQKKERIANYYIDQLFIASQFNQDEYHSASKMTQYTMNVKPKSAVNTGHKMCMTNKIYQDQETLSQVPNSSNNLQELNYNNTPSVEEKIIDPPNSNKLRCRSSRGIEITHYLVQGKY